MSLSVSIHSFVHPAHLQRARDPSPPSDNEPGRISAQGIPILDDVGVCELRECCHVEQVVKQLQPRRRLFLANVCTEVRLRVSKERPPREFRGGSFVVVVLWFEFNVHIIVKVDNIVAGVVFVGVPQVQGAVACRCFGLVMDLDREFAFGLVEESRQTICISDTIEFNTLLWSQANLYRKRGSKVTFVARTWCYLPY